MEEILLDIVIGSGKGGTGKTLIATNLALTLNEMGRDVGYLDCDVEEPDGHLFLEPDISEKKEIMLECPVDVDEDRCVKCGDCAEACSYNAIAVVNDNVLFFPELCHVCGACTIVCPNDAIIEKNKKVGDLIVGQSGDIGVNYANLETGEGGMSPRLINAVKEGTGEGINIIDSPPGTACPAVESFSGADLAILIADPTPFGLNDLKLSVDMCRGIGLEPVVIVNRAEYRDDELKEYCGEEDLEIIGEIPDDREIAETYSRGDMVVEESEEYWELFKELAENVGKAGSEEREVKEPKSRDYSGEMTKASEKNQSQSSTDTESSSSRKELVIISGKGGTGKTSLTASFASLSEDCVIADCDVDAADLHLLTGPENKESGLFSGGSIANIDQEKCISCGRCYEECRFEAIIEEKKDEELRYRIDEVECEGCGVCDIVCSDDAVEIKDSINGEWFISETRFGEMSHAKLGIAEENTGRLVTLVKENAEDLGNYESDMTLIDGSPGTGCPVIASLTGSDYAVVVTEPTVSGIHDMERVLDVTEHFGIESGIVINKADLNSEKTAEIKRMADEEDIEVLGEIPYDNVFTEAQMKGLSAVEYDESTIGEKIKKIWEKIRETM